MMEISVIIPTLNRAEGMERSVNSLMLQTCKKEKFEIIIVDNGSEDDTTRVAESICRNDGNARVRYIREERLGLHYARHAGMNAASGEILAFIDDDAYAEPGWVDALLECYATDDIGCVGGKIHLEWEKDPPIWVRRYGYGYLGAFDLGDSRMELKTPDLHGSNLSIRKKLLKQIGGFNPDSFGEIWLGDGETGMLKKVLKGNKKIIYNPKAVVWHVIPANRMTLEYLGRRAANEGACRSYAIYKEEHPGKGKLAVNAVGQFLRVVKNKCLGGIYGIAGKEEAYHSKIRERYHKNRMSYDLRLMYDKKLQNLVDKDDWVEEFQENNRFPDG